MIYALAFSAAIHVALIVAMSINTFRLARATRAHRLERRLRND